MSQIYAHTWQARKGATLHALVAAPGWSGRAPLVLACNHQRLAMTADGRELGLHYDYRITGSAIGSPICRSGPCQRLFRNPEGDDHDG